MKYQIYLNYRGHRDLLEAAIASLGEYGRRVVVFDNSHEQDLSLEEFRGEILRAVVPLWDLQAFRWLQKLVFERRQKRFFVMHVDGLVSPAIVEAMLEKADELDREGTPWGVLNTKQDVLCLFNAELLGPQPAMLGMEEENYLVYRRASSGETARIYMDLPVIQENHGRWIRMTTLCGAPPFGAL